MSDLDAHDIAGRIRTRVTKTPGHEHKPMPPAPGQNPSWIKS